MGGGGGASRQAIIFLRGVEAGQREGGEDRQGYLELGSWFCRYFLEETIVYFFLLFVGGNRFNAGTRAVVAVLRAALAAATSPIIAAPS